MIIAPQPIKYERNSIEYSVFKNEFFSGCDVGIYFGDLYIDEVINLEFSLQETKMPIYGYASYTFDAIAHGARIIQGNFSIVFKESGYLKNIYKCIAREGNNMKIMDQSGALITPSSIDNFINAARHATSEEFITLVQQHEQIFWGSEKAKEKKNQPHFSWLADNDEESANELLESGFNILISYGPLEQDTAFKYSTVRTICGVFLTGVTQSIAPSGQPLYETYSFIARDLDGDFTTL